MLCLSLFNSSEQILPALHAPLGGPYHRRIVATSHNNHPRPEATPVANAAVSTEAALFTQRVERLLSLIRPAIQEDGGDIELVTADPSGLVQIRLLGACVGCPSAGQTLHHGIERTLRSELGPDLRVEAVPTPRS
jgi:Fe-S cluster biogenesis protein NfuA